MRITMAPFEFLEVIGVFCDYLGVENLCHAFIMPSTKRNSMITRPASVQRSFFAEQWIGLWKGGFADVLQYLGTLALLAGAQVVVLLPPGVGPYHRELAV